MGSLGCGHPLTSGGGKLTSVAGFPTRKQGTGTFWALVPALGFLALFYVIPLSKLVIDSFFLDGSVNFDAYLQTLASSAFSTIFLRTVWLSLVVTILCLVLAFPLAHTLSRLSSPLAAGLILLVSVPYVTSVLVRTYGWIIILAPNGIINTVLQSMGVINEPAQLVFNTVGVYIGMVQVQLPLMVFPLYAAMRRFDHSLLDAAANLGSNRASAIRHIYLPLTRNGIISGCSLVFLSCLGFYVTPALLGGPGDYLIAQAITVRVNALADFSGASTQATILLLFTAVLMFFFRKQLTFQAVASVPDAPRSETIGNKVFRGFGGPLTRMLRTPVGSAVRHLSELTSKIATPVRWAMSVTILIALVLPLIVVIPVAFSDSSYMSFPPPSYSLRWFRKFLENRQWLDAARFSVFVCSCSVALSILIGLPASLAVARGNFAGRQAAYLLLISPIVLPQVVLALALYFLLSSANLAGTSFAFIIAYTLIGLPYAIIALVGGIHHLDVHLERAASSLGGTPATVFRTIALPLLLPSILSAAFFAFIMSFDDVIFGLYLGGTDAVPLPVRMWDDIRLEISPQVAVVATLVFGFMAFLYLAYWIGNSRLVPGTRQRRLS